VQSAQLAARDRSDASTSRTLSVELAHTFTRHCPKTVEDDGSERKNHAADAATIREDRGPAAAGPRSSPLVRDAALHNGRTAGDRPADPARAKGSCGWEWSYWTRNKLVILAGYLPAFNQASQGRASE
jgi:hypothetical protein